MKRSNAFEYNQFILRHDRSDEDLSGSNPEDEEDQLLNVQSLNMNQPKSSELPQMKSTLLSNYSDESSKYTFEKSKEKKEYQVAILHFHMEGKLVGYGLRVKPIEKSESEEITSLQARKIRKKPKMVNFQFIYSEEFHRYYSEIKDTKGPSALLSSINEQKLVDLLGAENVVYQYIYIYIYYIDSSNFG